MKQVKRPVPTADTGKVTGVRRKSPPPGDTRGARRRRETEAKLLSAAIKLMGERGFDGIAVNEITEEADVGFGTFYNYFPSKEAIHDALTRQVFEEFGDALDRALAELSDPAEIVAASVRHTLYRAREDQNWGRFLLREGMSQRMLTRGLGLNLLRDLQKGIATGRFRAADPLLHFLTIAGSTLTAIAMEISYGNGSKKGTPSGLPRGLEPPGSDFPQRAVASMLQALGLPEAEAERIARCPLPDIDGA